MNRTTRSVLRPGSDLSRFTSGTLPTDQYRPPWSLGQWPAQLQLEAKSVAAIVSQLLLRTADGRGRCAVNEILLKTSGLPNIIREGNTPMITTIIQGGRAQGMQLMDDALMALVEQGRITPREAYTKASNKARFEEGA